jgi:hypothetical protein
MLFELFLSDVLVVCEDKHGADGASELASGYHVHRVEGGQAVQGEQLVSATVEALVVCKRMGTGESCAFEQELTNQAK